MSRTPDRERILTLLNEFPEGLSNARVRADLRLSRQRYEEARAPLLADGKLEKYVCRGGGVRLTVAGERAVAGPAPLVPRTGESALYPIVVDCLDRERDEGMLSHTVDCASLRRRGKWQNPDVVSVLIEVYPRLQRVDVLLLSFEVKQRDAWDVSVVFEAASHQRVMHASTVILEWPEAGANLSDNRLADVVRECQRFGVGLATLEPGERGEHALNFLLDPNPMAHVPPAPGDVEGWLEYAFERMQKAADKHQVLLRTAHKRLQQALDAR